MDEGKIFVAFVRLGFAAAGRLSGWFGRACVELSVAVAVVLGLRSFLAVLLFVSVESGLGSVG